MKRKQKGFSLIELLIVVAIILIIAAIAIPNLIRAKMQANETSAVASLRTINTAEVVYSTTYNVPSVYAWTLTALSDGGASATNCNPPTSGFACLIDFSLASATVAPGKSGYIFTPGNTGNGTFFVNADPVSPGSTGQKHFYTDQTNVIRQDPNNAQASANSSPI